MILEVADQLFLFAINRDDGVAAFFKRGTRFFDVVELKVTIGMRHPLDVFLVCPEGESERGEHMRKGTLIVVESTIAPGTMATWKA